MHTFFVFVLSLPNQLNSTFCGNHLHMVPNGVALHSSVPVLIKLHCKKDGREILLPVTKKCFQVTFISFVANCSFFFNFDNHKCYCAAVSRKNQYLSTTSLPKLTEIRLFNGQKALFNHTMVLPPFLCTHCGLTHFKLNGPFL